MIKISTFYKMPKIVTKIKYYKLINVMLLEK